MNNTPTTPPKQKLTLESKEAIFLYRCIEEVTMKGKDVPFVFNLMTKIDKFIISSLSAEGKLKERPDGK